MGGRLDSGLVDLASGYLSELGHGRERCCLVTRDALREMVARGGGFGVAEMMDE